MCVHVSNPLCTYNLFNICVYMYPIQSEHMTCITSVCVVVSISLNYCMLSVFVHVSILLYITCIYLNQSLIHNIYTALVCVYMHIYHLISAHVHMYIYYLISTHVHMYIYHLISKHVHMYISTHVHMYIYH